MGFDFITVEFFILSCIVIVACEVIRSGRDKK
jgi:hypothetical protein